MTTKIVDRRHSAESEPDPEVESERMRRRADVRAAAAKLQFQKDRIPVLEAVLAESHRRVEVASDAHAATCEPLQSELASLEAAAVERIQRREPTDKIADSRRVEILREIASANAELEAVVEAEKVFRAPTERQVWDLRNKILDPAAVLTGLAQPPLASPSLQIRLHCSSQASRFAEARLNAAKRSLRIHEANVDGLRRGAIMGDLAAELFHVAKWEAEVEAAGEAVGAAQAEGREIHKHILDE